jgi:hypothetical protein
MNIDLVVIEGMRESRNLMLDEAIELCELVYENGGCAQCCVETLKSLKSKLSAADAKRSTRLMASLCSNRRVMS